ncbi:MAG: hypothetical protein HFJ24_01610 [Clostridia bacterium]|nr:hypothetical protein [Clostridia bacterium]MCI9274754.1 hypothetical protein [Clostridia bacterium]
MWYGLIAIGIYYFYNKEEAEDAGQNTISQETKIEPSNLRLGLSNIDSLNPILSKNQNIQDFSKLLYEPLFNITSDFKLEPALGIEFSKAEGNVYFVKLRENVKWHNGADFKAEDVKYTIEKIKELGDSSIYNANVSNINNVEIVGNNLVKLYLNAEEMFFEYNLTFPIISSSLFAGEDIRNSDKNNFPIGTGRYKLKAINTSSQMELEQNNNWWNKSTENLRINTITIRIYETIAEVYNGYKLRAD